MPPAEVRNVAGLLRLIGYAGVVNMLLTLIILFPNKNWGVTHIAQESLASAVIARIAFNLAQGLYSQELHTLRLLSFIGKYSYGFTTWMFRELSKPNAQDWFYHEKYKGISHESLVLFDFQWLQPFIWAVGFLSALNLVFGSLHPTFVALTIITTSIVSNRFKNAFIVGLPASIGIQIAFASKYTELSFSYMVEMLLWIFTGSILGGIYWYYKYIKQSIQTS